MGLHFLAVAVEEERVAADFGVEAGMGFVVVEDVGREDFADRRFIVAAKQVTARELGVGVEVDVVASE